MTEGKIPALFWERKIQDEMVYELKDRYQVDSL